MIYPKKLSVTNFCQFTSNSFTYKPGITVVTALNGSGKTNMFEVGQLFAWTGLVPGAKSKDTLVKADQKSGGTDVYFEDSRGCEYHLSRGVPGSKSLLKWKEKKQEKTISKNSEIAEWLEEKLGMPLKMFGNISFIRQGTFMNVVSDRQTRIEHFNRITDTLKFRDFRTMLVKAKSDLPDFPDQRPEIDNLTSQQEQMQQDEEYLRDVYKTLQQEREQFQQQEAEANRILSCPSGEGLDDQIKQKEQSIADLNQKCPECPQAPEQPEVTQEQVQKLRTHIVQLNNRREQLASVEQELINLQKPELEEDLDLEKVDVLEMKKGLLEAAKISVREGKCLLCNAELTEDFTEEKFQSEAVTASRTLDQIHEYQKRLHRYNSEKTRLEQSRDQLTLNVENQEVDAPDEKQLDAWEKQLSQYSQALGEYNRKLQLYHDHQRKVQQEQNLCNQLKERKSNSVTPEQQQWASEVQTQIKDVDTRLRQSWENYKAKSAELQGLRNQLERLHKEQQQREDMNAKKDMIERSAEHLKPYNLPMRIMQPFLQSFNPALQKYLSQFNVDYSCRMNPEFVYEFDRGYGWKDAEKWMSGGQLVNLALSSYLATMEIMSPSNPLLVLDEPTDSLDYVRKQGLIQAFSQLNAAYHNLYIIIITHDEEIKEAADYCVEMEYPE